MTDEIWRVDEIKQHRDDGDCFLLDISAYNHRKHDKTINIIFTAKTLAELQRLLDAKKSKEELQALAKAELQHFLHDRHVKYAEKAFEVEEEMQVVQQEFAQHRQFLADKLGLKVEDVPTYRFWEHQFAKGPIPENEYSVY